MAQRYHPYHVGKPTLQPREPSPPPQQRKTAGDTIVEVPENQTYHSHHIRQPTPPPPPITPNGTIIQLPANGHVAVSTGLIGPDNFVDVPRIARWAQYHPEWAEYLRAGGGNEEAWWLYLRNSGHKGYKVSGWTEVYEEREREAAKRKEEEVAKQRFEEAQRVVDIWNAGMMHSERTGIQADASNKRVEEAQKVADIWNAGMMRSEKNGKQKDASNTREDSAAPGTFGGQSHAPRSDKNTGAG